MFPFPTIAQAPTLDRLSEALNRPAPSVAAPLQRLQAQRESVIARVWPRGGGPSAPCY
jgi:hypothetical protein